MKETTNLVPAGRIRAAFAGVFDATAARDNVRDGCTLNAS